MLTGFTKLFQVPRHPDPEINLRARSVHTILLSTLGMTAAFLLYALFFPPYSQIILAAVALLLELGLLVLVRLQRINLVSAFLTMVLWLAVAYEVALYGGIRDTGFSAFVPIIIIAGLTMGAQAAFGITALTLLAALALGYAETQGWLPAYQQVSLVSVFISHSITLLAAALLIYLFIRSVASITWVALTGERLQKEINTQLEQNRSEMELQAAKLERQNMILQIAAEFTAIADRTKDEPLFLEMALQFLIGKVNSEYLSLFLLDETQNVAIQYLTLGPGGVKLELSQDILTVSISKYTTGVPSEYVLKFTAGPNSYVVEKPRLQSGMKAEVTVPMILGDRPLGLLTIQSSQTEIPVIGQEDLQTIADQLALSLQTLRLVDQLEARIVQANQLAGNQVQESWETYLQSGNLGFQYDRVKMVASGEDLPEDVRTKVAGKQHAIYQTQSLPQRSRLVIPIVLRDQAIGVLGYDHNDPDHSWQSDEISLLESIASRVSLALENTRLFSEAQRRAVRERMISQVSTDIRSTLDLQTILQTAVREIKNRLEVSEAEVQLLPPSEVPNFPRLDDKATE